MVQTDGIMNSYYDPNYVSDHYDEYGEKEWNRFTISIKNEVNFFIHKHYLNKYVKKGSKVLELGAGPGRFTIELAKLDCSIAVSDISQKQLNLNKEKVKEAGYEKHVIWRKKLDIVDLSSITEKFDAVILYGGALSYVFDKFNTALDNALSLLKDDGVVLLSVMSLQGTVHYFIKELFEDEVLHFGLDEMDRVNKTGNLTGDIARGHICKLYTWTELEELFEESNCSVIAASASNYLSNNHEERLIEIRKNEEYWKKFLEWELQYTADSGSLNNGSHILAVVKNRIWTKVKA